MVISFEAAMDLLREHCESRRLPAERLPVESADGRFLRADAVSQVDQPPFDTSSMDGYAVPAGDLAGEFEVARVVSAGQPAGEALAPGTAVKIMTGAPVPPGTQRVIMVEQAVETDGRVRFDNPSGRDNIRRRAENLAAGDVILRAGSRIGPLEIANLIGCGVYEIEVAKPARLFIFSTGNELVESADQLTPGKIVNTNGPMVARLAERCGLEIAGTAVLPDDPAVIKAALERARAAADLVVFTGGVSVGDFDFVPRVIEECGFTIQFSRVAFKPGKPLTFATDDSTLVFGLPGNPVSVYLMFHLIVYGAVAMISGGRYEPKTITVRLAEPFQRRSGKRMAYQPFRLAEDGLAWPIRYKGSGHLAALLQADGFVRVPKGITSLDALSEVAMIILD